MATYAASAGNFIRPYGRSECRHYPEAASQTFKRGEPLILDAASTENRVRKASDNPTAAIVGFAAEDATGVTSRKVGVWLAKPELKFRGKTFSTDAVDFTDIGSARALQAHASLTGVWVVDTSDAGNDSVVVEAYLPATGNTAIAEGDFEAEVVFHVDPKATIFGAGT